MVLVIGLAPLAARPGEQLSIVQFCVWKQEIETITAKPFALANASHPQVRSISGRQPKKAVSMRYDFFGARDRT